MQKRTPNMTLLTPKNPDLDNCLSEPPLMRIIAHGGGILPVADVVGTKIRETIESLGLKMDTNIIQRLCIDFIEKFNFETLPDLIMCLDAGRKNMYPNVKVYGTLTMEVLSGWMKYQLEAKYTEKENREYKQKKELRANNEKVVFNSRKEYLDWVQKGMKQQDELKDAKTKSKREKNSKTLEALQKVAVSIGRGGSKKK